MAKVTLTDIVSGYAVVSAYNDNNTAIAAALENTLSRDGTAPNAMSANLDMGSNLIRNLADGTLSADAINLRQLQATTGTAAAFPSQVGNANKVLKTDGTVVAWDVVSIAGGGTGAATASAARAALDVDQRVAVTGQVAFPAAQIPSANPNTLDDYEEGTWTPSIGGTATYTTQSGQYIKIGNLVIATAILVINVIGTGSTTSVSGLPFTAGAGTGFGFVKVYDNIASSVFNLDVVMNGLSNSVTINGKVAASNSNIDVLDPIFGNGAAVHFAVIYQV